MTVAGLSGHRWSCVHHRVGLSSGGPRALFDSATVPTEVTPPPALTGPVAVVIPARNEAEAIGKAVTSLLQQSCAESIHIFLVDDNSTDGTSAAALQAVAATSRANALTVISGNLCRQDGRASYGPCSRESKRRSP